MLLESPSNQTLAKKRRVRFASLLALLSGGCSASIARSSFASGASDSTDTNHIRRWRRASCTFPPKSSRS